LWSHNYQVQYKKHENHEVDFFLIFCFLLHLEVVAVKKAPLVDVQKEFAFAAKQYEGMLLSHPDLTKFPQSAQPNGKPEDRESSWWCSGFFAGSLWYLYEFTGDNKWKVAADNWTKALEKEKLNKNTHDLGFMLYCSYGNGYRITKNKEYLEPLLTGATSLATRFHPEYGLILSWDVYKDCKYPVIIDNMMNLEYLFWAAKLSKDKNLYDIAVRHADNTLKHHFRHDFSSFHMVGYLPDTKVYCKRTVQGANDSSAWARGQGWALYGFTVMYRETKNPIYLKQAEGVANYIMNHPNLPKDMVPYWDFNAPKIPNEERDASAAAVYASALLELCNYSPTHQQAYFSFAEQILKSLSTADYTSNLGENNYFILKHSVGYKAQKYEVDTPLVYADYYYLEALMRYNRFF
jgi:unsaturated chondroitin disaccharide hydrolase